MVKQQHVYISDSLNNFFKQANPKQREMIEEMLAFYINEYRTNQKSKPDQRPDLAGSIQKMVQGMIDKKIADTTEHTVSCKKGCSFCCFLSVDITDDEAMLLIKYADQLGIDIDYAHLEKQNLKKTEFDKLPIKDQRCVFLDKDDACTVYEYRPNSCRKLIAVTDPNDCDTYKRMGAQVGRLIDVEVEVLSCATTNATKSGTMAEMLLKVCKKK